MIVSLALTAGALLSRPWGGFWWALRPDALLVGVLIGLETRRRAEWLKLIPKIGLGLATYWLLVAAVLARVLSIGGTGAGLVAVAVIFGMVVAGRGRDMGARAPFGAKPLRWIGERSFSIYLVHLPVLSGLRAALLEQAPPWAAAALATIGAVLAALCLERCGDAARHGHGAAHGGADMRRQRRQCLIARRRPHYRMRRTAPGK